jgi:hypothetical protein
MLIRYKCSEEFFYGIEDMSSKNSYKGFVEMDEFDEEKLKQYCIKKHNLNTDWDIKVKGKKIDKI